MVNHPTTIHVRVSRDLKKRIKRQAKKEKIDVSKFIRQAIGASLYEKDEDEEEPLEPYKYD